jgi:hypothetical protein
MSKRYWAVFASIAALWLAFTGAETLYAAVRLIAPQLTSQDYQDLRSGRIKVPPILIGHIVDEAAYLEAARREAMWRELDKERSSGRNGAIIWGSLLLGSAAVLGLTWQAIRQRQPGAV